MRHIFYLILLFVTIVLNAYSGEVTSAGIRASRYGIEPFPEPIGWHHAIYTMITYFPSTEPTTIWTVGGFWDPNECHLYFPNDQGYPTENMSYEESIDLNEEFLTYFDGVGIKVYLQVEPGPADIKTLIDMVLERYGDHSSVIGFGVDVEWYECVDSVWGKKVTDDLAEQWEGWVKEHDDSYKLFLKHPARTPKHFPENYRGEIVFVNDCEGKDTIDGVKGFDDYENDFLGVMDTFANYFYPNTIFYQIGYPSIEKLWEDFDPKPKVIGDDLEKICGTDQELGVFWVDFGMKDVLPYDNDWDVQDWPTDFIIHNNSKKVNNVFMLNPHQKFNLTVFSLNGRLLQSIYGYSDKMGNLIAQRSKDNTKQIYGNSGIVIYRIKQGEKSFITKINTFK